MLLAHIVNWGHVGGNRAKSGMLVSVTSKWIVLARPAIRRSDSGGRLLLGCDAREAKIQKGLFQRSSRQAGRRSTSWPSPSFQHCDSQLVGYGVFMLSTERPARPMWVATGNQHQSTGGVCNPSHPNQPQMTGKRRGRVAHSTRFSLLISRPTY